MSVRSVRFPEELEAAIRYVATQERTELAGSLRKLTRLGFETYLVRSFGRGELTLRQVARLLDVGLWDALDLLSDAGVGGNVTAAEMLPGLEILRT